MGAAAPWMRAVAGWAILSRRGPRGPYGFARSFVTNPIRSPCSRYRVAAGRGCAAYQVAGLAVAQPGPQTCEEGESGRPSLPFNCSLSGTSFRCGCPCYANAVCGLPAVACLYVLTFPFGSVQWRFLRLMVRLLPTRSDLPIRSPIWSLSSSSLNTSVATLASPEPNSPRGGAGRLPVWCTTLHH